VLCDFDDFCEDAHRLDLLCRLREANPAFRCTLFAIPARGSDDFWAGVPEWCELAVHGWAHPDPHEAENWTYEDASAVLVRRPFSFVRGFKAPGWQVSDGTYRALMDQGWWIADHWENDSRRPSGIEAHVIRPAAAIGADPDHWHGHIGNDCGNGIEETFDRLEARVRQASSFEVMSEVVTPWL
jgi:hypothetical protein